MDTLGKSAVPGAGARAGDAAAVRVWEIVREPFTAGTWRRAAYAVIAFPVGVACVPLALTGAPAGRWQRQLVRRLLGAEADGGPRAGLVHALAAVPVNLVAAFVTVYGWSIVPMNLGWPLRAGSDYSDAWGGPTFAGAWTFHAVVGGMGFLLLMPWVVRGLTAVQRRLATALLFRPAAAAPSAPCPQPLPSAPCPQPLPSAPRPPAAPSPVSAPGAGSAPRVGSAPGAGSAPRVGSAPRPPSPPRSPAPPSPPCPPVPPTPPSPSRL